MNWVESGDGVKEVDIKSPSCHSPSDPREDRVGTRVHTPPRPYNSTRSPVEAPLLYRRTLSELKRNKEPAVHCHNLEWIGLKSQGVRVDQGVLDSGGSVRSES